jgi:hypothetical protein
MDAAGFRSAFPAFTEALFPDARVTFWLALGAKRLSADRFAALYDQAVCLFAAHNLTLERAAGLDASGTGGMSAAAGPVTAESKTVGPVSKSKSYSQATTADPNGRQWNATIYGQQLFDLMQLVGVGGVCV